MLISPERGIQHEAHFRGKESGELRQRLKVPQHRLEARIKRRHPLRAVIVEILVPGRLHQPGKRHDALPFAANQIPAAAQPEDRLPQIALGFLGPLSTRENQLGQFLRLLGNALQQVRLPVDDRFEQRDENLIPVDCRLGNPGRRLLEAERIAVTEREQNPLTSTKPISVDCGESVSVLTNNGVVRKRAPCSK